MTGWFWGHNESMTGTGSGKTGDSLPVVRDLAELLDLVRRYEDGARLYVRWSRGPDQDGAGDDPSSVDALTGVPLPGLSVNPLRMERWWADRSPELWLARKLFDYHHLRELRGDHIRAWVLTGSEVARGPDNEPLVRPDQPVAWIDDAVLAECERMIAAQRSDEWGSLDRRS